MTDFIFVAFFLFAWFCLYIWLPIDMAESRGHSVIIWVALTWMFSPLILILLAIMVAPKKKEKTNV